ncbi:conserved hypothetical protein [Uncinocarpus reesii 1704]|uniref:Methyltransferase domain-containing protein n=1 Tax=Uncinocarpus reesii (strain UAMH 1704) TaxID=336963 RepID=C4JG41_UNCRE|nr:uncharacterized protein UREG_02439 [Uncinocarpus reesii 1704]EEP77590.1 conserved hypothetical protein [Uncinocarpus reesii 1704]
MTLDRLNSLAVMSEATRNINILGSLEKVAKGIPKACSMIIQLIAEAICWHQQVSFGPQYRDPRSGTTELDGSFLEILTFEGREFQKHAVENDIYFSPVDDEEIDRLDLQHRVLNHVFDHRLIFPPVDRLAKVLDCGYGSGAWAVEVAEQYESCDVDDLNRHFTFGYSQFDLVHSRLVASGINQQRWPHYMRDIVKYIRALEDVKDVRAGIKLSNLMASAGLVDVESKMIPLPLSGWPTDSRMKAIGAANRDNAQRWLSSLALYPFMQKLHMSRSELDDLISQAREEADDPSLRAYVPL